MASCQRVVHRGPRSLADRWCRDQAEKFTPLGRSCGSPIVKEMSFDIRACVLVILKERCSLVLRFEEV
jgi:hypothetical protein